MFLLILSFLAGVFVGTTFMPRIGFTDGKLTVEWKKKGDKPSNP